MHQSETAGERSTYASAMEKHLYGPWLWVPCQEITEPNLLLCMKLPDFSAQTRHLCPTSLQTAHLLPKAYNHPESSTFFVICHNTARSLSSGSLLTVGLQETKRRIILPSLAANKSSATWKSLMERPMLWSSSFFTRSGCKHIIHHLMTRCITCHTTNRPPSSAFVLATAICTPICTTSACHTHQTANALQSHKPQSTSCSLVSCTGKPGASYYPMKLRDRRSYVVPCNSLKKTQFTSSFPQTSRSEIFSKWNAEEGEKEVHIVT